MAVVILWLLVAGLVELSVIIVVAHVIGWVATGLLLVLTSAGGAWIVKRQGTAAWRRVVERVRAGQMPASDLIDGGMAVVAGALLLVPGFLSDAVGLSLALPPVRAAARGRAVRSLQRRVESRVGAATRAASRAASFGFGTPGGRAYRRPSDGFGPEPSYHSPNNGRDDVLDLDSEEIFIDEPKAELEPPRDPNP